ncbi:MAG: ribosome-associated translation inhibitor RaiA [Bacilli bacterium]
MKFQIVGKNIEITDAISNVIKKKLTRMNKYFDENDDILCRAVCSAYNHGTKVEVTIFTKFMTFRAEVKDPDLYAAVDFAIDKLEGQMRKLKTQMEKRYGHEGLGKSIIYENIKDQDDELENAEIVRTKSYDLEPMSMEDAITHMEALDHTFFLYLDNDDERISVVYKRNDGGYGLIQAENKVEM